MKKKQFYRASEYLNDIDKFHESGMVRGVETGYNGLDELYSIKLGSTTYIAGRPFSGKSEVWFQILVNLSVKLKWNHAIFSPETGYKHEIAAKIISIFKGIPFERLTKNELEHGKLFVDSHFFIIDPDDSITIKDFFETIDDIELLYGVRIHTSMGDPFNEFKHLYGNTPRDLHLEELLGMVRQNARKHNRHNCIITHTSNQKFEIKEGVRYYPPAMPSEWAGGEAWFRKAEMMLQVYRPNSKIPNEAGEYPQENETHVIVHKFKPYWMGKQGFAKIYLNKETRQFYEIYGNINFPPFKLSEYLKSTTTEYWNEPTSNEPDPF